MFWLYLLSVPASTEKDWYLLIYHSTVNLVEGLGDHFDWKVKEWQRVAESKLGTLQVLIKSGRLGYTMEVLSAVNLTTSHLASITVSVSILNPMNIILVVNLPTRRCYGSETKSILYLYAVRCKFWLCQKETAVCSCETKFLS